MSKYAVMPLSDYEGVCDSIRNKTGTTEFIKSGELVEKIDDVFEAGKAQGGGGDGWYDTFWDGLQDYGKRTQYQYFLYFIGTIDWFRPKYDIRPRNAAWFARDFGKDIHYTTPEKYMDLVERLSECGVVIDFSQCTDVSYFFYQACFTHLPVLDVRNAGNTIRYLAFGGKVKTIDELIVTENQILDQTFGYASSLENLTMGGTIGQNLDIHWSALLAAESYHSIITHCSKTASFSLTLPAEATVRSVYDAKYGSGAWDTITAEYSNLTISYM